MNCSIRRSSCSVARTWSARAFPVEVAKTSGVPSAMYVSSGSLYTQTGKSGVPRRRAIAAGPSGMGASLPKKGIRYPLPMMSRSIAVITISCSRSASSTLRMPPWSRVSTLMPSRARVSRYHSKSGRGSTSSAKKLTGASVADQIAATTSYEPMWHETTSAPLPMARACSRCSQPSTLSSFLIVSTRAFGSCIRSAYAFAWSRKFSQDIRRSAAGSCCSSGQAIFRLYSRRGLARGENHQAKRAAITASA